MVFTRIHSSARPFGRVASVYRRWPHHLRCSHPIQPRQKNLVVGACQHILFLKRVRVSEPLCVLAYDLYVGIRELERTQGLLTLPRICNPDDGDIQLRDEAEAEFFAFVNETFRRLFQIESCLLTSRPSIGVFCRLDIGLMVVDGKVNYFVNEVERTQTASLWNNPPKGTRYPSRIGLIGATFAHSFYKWISYMKQPILL